VSKKVLYSISDFFIEKSKLDDKTLNDLKKDLNDLLQKEKRN